MIAHCFGGKGTSWFSPNYWHFTSTTCRQCLQLAGPVYLWQTVSTHYKPPCRMHTQTMTARCFGGKGTSSRSSNYWHLTSTTCRQCLQLARRVYLWHRVSTNCKPPSRVHRQTMIAHCFGEKGTSGSIPSYWHFTSTTCRQSACLQLAGRVYSWQTVSTHCKPPCRMHRQTMIAYPFFCLPKHWHFKYTTCRQCLQLARRVYLWHTVSTHYKPPSRVHRPTMIAHCFGGKGTSSPSSNYWHFTSTTCRQSLQLAGHVYLWHTVSTHYKPPSHVHRQTMIARCFGGTGTSGSVCNWQAMSTCGRQCLHTTNRLRVCIGKR